MSTSKAPSTMAEDNLPGYLVALCVLIPFIVFVCLIVVLYVICSRKYRLNWFEKNLLEQEEEKQYITETTYTTNGSTGQHRKPSTVKFADEVQHSPVTPYSSQRRRSSIFQYNPLAENKSDLSESDEFWVPPAVIERKRAQSVIAVGPSPVVESAEEGSIFSPDFSGAPSHNQQQSSTYDLGSIVTVPQQQHGVRRGRRASMHEAIDYTKLDTSMYKKQLHRQLSVSRSEDESMGSVNFKLDFSSDTGLFTVRLIQVTDLPAPDANETMDPYCKVRVYSDTARGHHEQHSSQTKVVKNTPQPEFDEEFLFEVLPEMLSHTTLEICVYNQDQYSEDEMIGFMRLDVDGVDFSQGVSLWKNLVAPGIPQLLDFGRLMFTMAYLTSAERLTIVILKAKNLKGLHSSNDDVHVKVSILHQGRKIKKKKTTTKHGSSPAWNEALVFSLPKDILAETTLEFAVIHENRLDMNELIGRVVTGRDCPDADSEQWNDVINGRSTLARWHDLSL